MRMLSPALFQLILPPGTHAPAHSSATRALSGVNHNNFAKLSSCPTFLTGCRRLENGSNTLHRQPLAYRVQMQGDRDSSFSKLFTNRSRRNRLWNIARPLVVSTSKSRNNFVDIVVSQELQLMEFGKRIESGR